MRDIYGSKIIGILWPIKLDYVIARLNVDPETHILNDYYKTCILLWQSKDGSYIQTDLHIQLNMADAIKFAKVNGLYFIKEDSEEYNKALVDAEGS
jgi:hypothetical protein